MQLGLRGIRFTEWEYRRTSLFAVDTFWHLTSNTETANTESNND
jgi:hypothetical protein